MSLQITDKLNPFLFACLALILYLQLHFCFFLVNVNNETGWKFASGKYCLDDALKRWEISVTNSNTLKAGSSDLLTIK